MDLENLRKESEHYRRLLAQEENKARHIKVALQSQSRALEKSHRLTPSDSQRLQQMRMSRP